MALWIEGGEVKVQYRLLEMERQLIEAAMLAETSDRVLAVELG